MEKHKKRKPCCIPHAIEYLRESLQGSVALGGEFLDAYQNGYKAGYSDAMIDDNEDAIWRKSIKEF